MGIMEKTRINENKISLTYSTDKNGEYDPEGEGVGVLRFYLGKDNIIRETGTNFIIGKRLESGGKPLRAVTMTEARDVIRREWCNKKNRLKRAKAANQENTLTEAISGP